MLYSQDIQWFVVFHPGKTFFSKRFRHVSLLGFHEGTWLYIDLHRTSTDIAVVFNYDEKKLMIDGLKSEHVLVQFDPAAAERKSHFFMPTTCVTFVKHAIGINSSALRPDTLFNDLVVKQGMRVIDETKEKPSAD